MPGNAVADIRAIPKAAKVLREIFIDLLPLAVCSGGLCFFRPLAFSSGAARSANKQFVANGLVLPTHERRSSSPAPRDAFTNCTKSKGIS
jgi:hypothetical protein